MSTQTVRYYEREGLIIPWRSTRGTRRYTRDDLGRIRTIRLMMEQEGLNVAGIRRVLAMLPCWELRDCKRRECRQRRNDQSPCWMNRDRCGCRRRADDCRECDVYRVAFDVLSGRQRLHLARRSALRFVASDAP